MKNLPNPLEKFPVKGVDYVIYVKNEVKNPNIIVGDFTYFSDTDFEKHVTHHYDFYNDKLIIGKFCQIAKGIKFIMNGANHKMNGVSTFPFYIFDGFNQEVPSLTEMPLKGDTIIGNDVWIGENVTILPGVKIADGSIIGANSVVSSDTKPYTINAGNPCRFIKKRFDDELIALLLEFKWWDKEVFEINELIPLLTSGDLENVKNKIKEKINIKE